MTLDQFKNLLYKERQAVDAISTTIKQNVSSLLSILAAISLPLTPAIFAANGAYTLLVSWNETLKITSAIILAVGLEGAGMGLSMLAIKTYSSWREKLATKNEIFSMASAVMVYTIIAISLIAFSNVPTELKVIVGAIPILAIAFYVGMGFDTDLANRADKAADEKRIRKEERKLAKLEKVAPVPAPVPAEPAQAQHICQHCERKFGSMQAINAHMRFCKIKTGEAFI